MLEEAKNSVKATLYERVSNPFTGAFVISWITWNYKIVLHLFSSDKASTKIHNIEMLFANDTSLHWLSVLGPLTTAGILIFLLPQLNYYAFKYTSKIQVKFKQAKLKCDNETPISEDKARQLRKEINAQHIEFDNALIKKNEDIDKLELEKSRFKEDINKLEEKNAQLSAYTAQLKKENVDFEKEKHDLEIRYNRLEEEKRDLEIHYNGLEEENRGLNKKNNQLNENKKQLKQHMFQLETENKQMINDLETLKQNKPIHITVKDKMILEAISNQKGITDYDLQHITDIPDYEIYSIINKLSAMGYINVNNEKHGRFSYYLTKLCKDKLFTELVP